MATTIHARKAKARRLQKWVRDMILAHFPLQEDDVRSTAMGQNGIDVQLSPLAREHFNYDVECVDGETEFLSPNGWVEIKNYHGEKILTWAYWGVTPIWKEEGTTLTPSTFELPLKPVIAKDRQFYHFKTRNGIDQKVTGGHRMPYYNTLGIFCVGLAEAIAQHHDELDGGFRGQFPATFPAAGNTHLPIFESVLRLRVIHAAKGEPLAVSQLNDFNTIFRVRTLEQYERLIRLLEDTGTPYIARGLSSEDYRWVVNCTFPDMCKSIPRYVPYDSVTEEIAKIILDEMKRWADGVIAKRYHYITHIKENADFIQYCYAVTGIRASVARLKEDRKRSKWTGAWEVKASKLRKHWPSLAHSGPVEVCEVKENAYCFETRTGYWVARRNGNIFITGNCKACERISVWNAWKDTTDGSKKGVPLLIMTKNREEPKAVMNARDLFALLHKFDKIAFPERNKVLVE